MRIISDPRIDAAERDRLLSGVNGAITDMTEMMSARLGDTTLEVCSVGIDGHARVFLVDVHTDEGPDQSYKFKDEERCRWFVTRFVKALWGRP